MKQDIDHLIAVACARLLLDFAENNNEDPDDINLILSVDNNDYTFIIKITAEPRDDED